MRRQYNIYYILGNALIALSFLGFVFIYFPVFKTYFFPEIITVLPHQPYISIPKINAKAPIIQNVNPWDKKEYLEALSHGVAHAKGTSLPGEKGTIYLFAHSSDAPWRLTRYNTIFMRLNQLKKGDKIIIYFKDRKYMFIVKDKKIVWPTDISYITNSKKDQLILQTCYPIGTDMMRLLVFASQESIF